MNGPQFSLGVSGIPSPQDTHYSLGVAGVGTPQPAPYSLGVGSLPPPFLGVDGENPPKTAPRPENSILDLTIDTAAELAHRPQASTALNVAKAIHDVSKAIGESQNPSTQDMTCKTVKVVTQLAVEEAGSKLIVGGLPLLMAESIAYPPLALAIPVAGAALPQAFANLQEVAKIAGEAAEVKCQELFSGNSGKN